jgi:endonuclease/exonuclease/phosphatase family metal-dependent hydrolase
MNSSIYNPNKERGKIAAIAETILERDYDLVGIVEVGGMESLENFNRIYLGGRYDCFLHEENSRRGIYAGALVKRGRFRSVEARAMPGAFSRNLLRLRLGLPAAPRAARAGRGDCIEVFVVHLKSQYGEDRGIPQRIREVEMLSSELSLEDCVVMGDFNGILIPGEAEFEYEPFLALPFRDVLEAMDLPHAERRTHYHFDRSGPNFAQLDYIFCSEDIEVLDAGVLEREIPLNRTQRDRLPSDHLFIEAEIRPAAWRRASLLSRLASRFDLRPRKDRMVLDER